MTFVYQQIGNAIAKWDTESPLKWSMEECVGKGDRQRTNQYEFDFTPLEAGYEITFLVALRDSMVAQRHRLALRSIYTEFLNIRSLFKACQEAGIMAVKTAQIDGPFLLGLSTIEEKISSVALNSFRRIFESNRSNTELFCPTLHPDDFSKRKSKRGGKGDAIHRILATALTRSTMVAILDVLEAAFETGQIDIGRYSFGKLAFNIFCRPTSYRQITLSDLRPDKDTKTGETEFFLDVIPVKTRLKNPRKITYRLHRDVGQLLALQREFVVEKHGHLYPDELGKLALFPAARLKSDGTWVSAWSNENYGMVKEATGFTKFYLRPLSALAKINLSATALRHTIATQLAQAQCSAQTIAAVLKHATDHTCQVYVDIVFEGLIDQLSDALEPAFREHFPVLSVSGILCKRVLG